VTWDNTLYAAAAKGPIACSRLPSTRTYPPSTGRGRPVCRGDRPLQPDLVLVGVQAHDEWDGGLAPFLATALCLPYLGVVRGVKAGPEPNTISACKEFPGAVMARLKVRLPAVLGILAAEQAPRYVPVSRIRAAMKSTQLEEATAGAPGSTSIRPGRSPGPLLRVCIRRNPEAAPRCSPAQTLKWPPASRRSLPRKEC